MATVLGSVWIALLVVVFVAWTQVVADARAVRGGRWCPCPNAATSLRCNPAFLRFRPIDGSYFASGIQDAPATSAGSGGTNVIYVAKGSPLPLISVQIAKLPRVEASPGSSLAAPPSPTSAAADPFAAAVAAYQQQYPDTVELLTDVDPPVNISVTLVASVLSDGLTLVGSTTERAVRGEARFSLTVATAVVSTTDAVFFLNFTSDTGLWLRSPDLTYSIQRSSRLRFASPRSYFSASPDNLVPGSETSAVFNRTLPAIVVQVTDKGGNPITDSGDLLSEEGKKIVVSVVVGTSGKVVLSGNTSTVVGSEAVFDRLVIRDVPIAPFRLRFEVVGNPDLVLTSPVLRATSVPAGNARLDFGERSQSFITRTPSFRSAAVAVKLPPVVVQMLDSGFGPDSSENGLIITATCATAVLDPPGMKAAVRDGRATFDRLMFTSLLDPGASTSSVVIAFTADPVGTATSPLAAGRRLFSPPITVSRAVQRVVGMRFRQYDSLIRAEGEGAFAVSNVVMTRIAIELYDEGNNLVPTSGVEIGVTPRAEGGASEYKGSSSSRTFNGAAEFDYVLFNTKVASKVFTLVFSSSALNTLTTGPITVTRNVTSAVSMRFEVSPMSLVNDEYRASFATRNVPLRPIVIEILNALGKVDTAANDIVVEASSTVFVTFAKSISQAGRVVFPGIVFGVAGSARLVFTAQTPTRGASPVDGQRLVTGYFSIAEMRVPAAALVFLPTSFIAFEGQRVAAAVTHGLPPVHVAVVDSTRVVDTGVQNLVVTVSSTEPSTLAMINPSGPANVFVETFTVPVVGGVATFNCSRIRFGSTGGRPQLRFTAGYADITRVVNEATSSVVVGSSILTGAMRFVEPHTPIRVVPLALYPNATGLSLFNATPIEDTFTTRLYGGPGEAFAIALRAFSANGQPLTITDPLSRGDDVVVATTAAGEMANGSARFAAMRPGMATPAPGPRCSGSGSSTPDPNGGNIAVFEDLRFPASPPIEGYFTSITFTPRWAVLAAQGPLVVGPFYQGGIQATDAQDVVVVAEVLMTEPVFSVDRWVEELARVMHLDIARIEVVRMRPGATAVAGFSLEWSGTRVELRFLSPTTETENKATSQQLAQQFLGMDVGCATDGLRIRRRFLRSTDRSCDVYRIDDQLAAAARCVSVSSPSLRCRCYEPLFALLGEPCRDLWQLQLLCSEVRRCASNVIVSSCASFEQSVTLQYVAVAGWSVLAAVVVGVVIAWRTGWIARRFRTRLGGNRGSAAKAVSIKEPLPPRNRVNPMMEFA